MAWVSCFCSLHFQMLYTWLMPSKGEMCLSKPVSLHLSLITSQKWFMIAKGIVRSPFDLIAFFFLYFLLLYLLKFQKHFIKEKKSLRDMSCHLSNFTWQSLISILLLSRHCTFSLASGWTTWWIPRWALPSQSVRSC